MGFYYDWEVIMGVITERCEASGLPRLPSQQASVFHCLYYSRFGRWLCKQTIDIFLIYYDQSGPWLQNEKRQFSCRFSYGVCFIMIWGVAMG